MNKNHFLNAHKIDRNIYITGIYYPGITIYNQQIRTLNLVYLLHSKNGSKWKDSESKAVIIGGGISGITAAVAFKRLGYEVSILEERSILMHMQHGCVTRKVHPNLYDWPAATSVKPFTELPFLNWKYSDAGKLERDLLQEFEKENFINCYYRIGLAKNRTTMVSTFNKEIRFSHKDNLDDKLSYSILLIATGFGVEKYVGKKEQTKSYWRNEDYSQLRLNDQTRKFFISGTGDGGITDVCRIALIAFDPLEWSKRFESMKKKQGKMSVYDRLIYIYNSSDPISKKFQTLFDDYEYELKLLIEKNTRKNKDIDKVIINGREDKKTIEEVIDTRKMSFLNAWMIFLLEKTGIVKYKAGSFPKSFGNYLFTPNDDPDFQIIVRHGTDREVRLQQLQEIHAKISDADINRIKELQEDERLNEHSIEPQWELYEWDPSPKPMNYYQVSDKLVDLSKMFLSVTQNYIEKKYKTENYRMTVHRLITFRDKYYFQQLSPYYSYSNSSNRAEGRIFPVDHGIVGYSLRSMKTIKLIPRNASKTELKKLEELLFNFEHIKASKIDFENKQFLSIPVVDKNSELGLLCFYLEIDELKSDLLDDVDLRNKLYTDLQGFANYLASENVGRERVVSEHIKGPVTKHDLEIEQFDSLSVLDDEVRKSQGRKRLKMDTDKLIEIFDDEKST